MNTRLVDPRSIWALLAMEAGLALPIISLPAQGDRLPGVLGPLLLLVLLPLLSYPNKFDTYLGGWSTALDPDDSSRTAPRSGSLPPRQSRSRGQRRTYVSLSVTGMSAKRRGVRAARSPRNSR